MNPLPLGHCYIPRMKASWLRKRSIRATASGTALPSDSGRSSTSGSPDSLTCQMYSSWSQLAPLRYAWDHFVETHAGDVFTTFDWCSIWWKHYGHGRRLEVYVFTEKAELVGILPLFRETLRIGPVQLRAIRVVGCDHSPATCDVVIADGHQQEVISGLRDRLCPGRSEPWDLFHIGPLPGYRKDVKSLQEDLAGSFGLSANVTVRECGPHTVFKLPSSSASFASHMSKNMRTGIKKETRRLYRRHRVTVSYATGRRQIVEAFQRLVTLHDRQWQAKGLRGYFGEWPRSESFYLDIAQAHAARGRTILQKIHAEDEPLSVLFALRFGKSVHALLYGRSSEKRWNFCSPGRFAVWTLIRNAIAAGMQRVDALRADYDHERRMGATILKQQSISIVNSGRLSRFKYGVFWHVKRLLSFGYHRLWYRTLGPRLGLLRAPLWESYIRSRI